jgi:predicted nucleotidyltransferase
MLDPEKSEIVEETLDRKEVVSAYLYGSVAKGTENERSDIDIGLLLKDQELLDFKQVSRLERALTEKLGRKVDLRVLNGREPRFLYNVLREGELIFCSDERARVDFEYRTMRNYLDMKPFYDEYDSMVKQRLTG